MQTPTYTDMARAKYISLTTFRRNGDPVSTPVWIAPAEDGHFLYVFTGANTGKVRRITKNPRVELAPCTFRGRLRGPVVSGTASILPPAEHAIAGRALTRKYPVAKRLLFTVNRVTSRRRASEWSTYLRIELASAAATASIS